ncbi:hypothetical protein QQP08_026298 [Theobroma cacao]|nr:hypothetical protein QQP08_026298 [Theobroma cacao]
MSMMRVDYQVYKNFVIVPSALVSISSSINALELYCNKFLLVVELLEEYLSLEEPMRSDPKILLQGLIPCSATTESSLFDQLENYAEASQVMCRTVSSGEGDISLESESNFQLRELEGHADKEFQRTQTDGSCNL